MKIKFERKQMMSNLVDQVMEKSSEELKRLVADKLKFNIQESKQLVR